MGVTVRSFIAAARSTESALVDLGAQLSDDGIAPSFALAFYDDTHDDQAILEFLRTRLPEVPVIGGTSSHGLVGPRGLTDAPAVGLLTMADPEGSFGAAVGEAGDDPAAAAEALLHRAMADAEASGELPELIFTFLAPGIEEAALDGFQRVVGDRCPIVGGTSFDNHITGQWRQLGPDGFTEAGIAVAVLTPSGGVSLSFQGGYEPTGVSGTVTEVAGRDTASREIVSIDGERAADVYDAWSGSTVVASSAIEDRTLARQTVRHPFGIEIGTAGGISYYRLIQPGPVDADGNLETFAGVAQGDRVCLMRGSEDGLIRRAGTVVATALSDLATAGSQAAGGLVIYCAGCRLAVGDRIDEVVSALQSGFADAPFLGLFTGGEQGPVLGRAMHNNLMIAAIAFGR